MESFFQRRKMNCDICGKSEDGIYDIISRDNDGKLECVDCWLKRENKADKARETKRRNI